LNRDLEDQRAKNNDLRSKNWKTVEALNNVEQKYQNLLKKPSDNKKELQSVLKEAEQEAEQSQKLFLQRLFPEIKASEAIKGHNEWLDQFAFEVNKFKEESKQTADKCKQQEEKPPVPAVDDEQLQKLEGQVKHYKSVLAETETMLNQLQASVEIEEDRWKSKLSKKEIDLEKLQSQLEAVESKNAALEASMNSLNSVEEMETKLRELQEKLAIEEADKLQLQTQLHQCLESEEIGELKQKIEAETQLRQDLDEKVAKMNQLLATGQEALAQEKKTVELLRQQLASPETPVKTVNGQDELLGLFK